MISRFFRTSIAAIALALPAISLAGPAFADVDGAKGFVEVEHGKIKKLVDANAPSPDVLRAIDGMVDYDELTKRTLGNPCPAAVPQCVNHWNDLTPDQRTEITGLLKQLVERNFQKNLVKTQNFDVTYKGGKEQGDNLSRVKTEAKDKAKPRDPAVEVDYVVLGAGGYKCVDIVTEGSSLTKNYYDQFHRMLTTPGQGYTYVVQKLRDKIAQKQAQ